MTQLALTLEVPSPYIPARFLQPGDEVQVRDQAGARLWTLTVTHARTHWRFVVYAWPTCGLGHFTRTTRVHAEPASHSTFTRAGLHPNGPVELVNDPHGHAHARTGRPRPRLSAWAIRTAHARARTLTEAA